MPLLPQSVSPTLPDRASGSLAGLGPGLPSRLLKSLCLCTCGQELRVVSPHLSWCPALCSPFCRVQACSVFGHWRVDGTWPALCSDSSRMCLRNRDSVLRATLLPSDHSLGISPADHRDCPSHPGHWPSSLGHFRQHSCSLSLPCLPPGWFLVLRDLHWPDCLYEQGELYLEGPSWPGLRLLVTGWLHVWQEGLGGSCAPGQ